MDLSLHLADRCNAVGRREDDRGQVDGLRFLLFAVLVAYVQQTFVKTVVVAQRERLAKLLGLDQLPGFA